MEIKELRKRYNLTQTKLAQELGVTSRTVQNWEAGKAIPTRAKAAINMLAKKYESVRDVGVVAGDNADIALKDCPFYSVPDFIALGADYLVRVSDNSMIPRYNKGDILACRRLAGLSWLQWGKVYVLDTDQGVLVKRLFPCDKSDDFVECRSENSDDYADFDLPKSSIRTMSIVVGMIGIE